MTTVPSGPYSTPPIAPSSTTATDVKKVSSAGYWISGAIFLIGSVVAVTWFIVSIVSLVNAPDDFARVDVPGQMKVELASGDWVVYHEYPGADSSFSSRPEPDVAILDPTGDPVSVRRSGLDETYSDSDHEGRAIGKFDADTAGVYTVIVTGDTQRSEEVAIGRPLFDGGVILGIVGSIIVGVVAFLVALVLLIITIVRRSKAKKARTGGGLPPAGYAPAYPGAPVYGAGYGTPPPPGGYPPAYPPAPTPTGYAPPPAPTPTGYAPPPAPSQPSTTPPPADATPTPGWATPQPTSGPIPPPPAAPPAAASPPPDAPAESEAAESEQAESEQADPDAARSWSPLDGDPNKPGAF